MTVCMIRFTRDGTEIFFDDYSFQTPLHRVAWTGKGDIVEILLRNGANVHEKHVKISEMRSGGEQI